MPSTAATLEILVNARTQQATSSLRRMDQSARTSATHLSNLDRASGRLGATLKSAAGAALGAGAAYVGLTAAKDAFQATTDLAKSTLNLNQNLGLTSKTAIELATQLKVRGADAQKTAMAFKTFATQLNGAATGSTSAKDKFAQLGITGQKLQRDLKNPQQALFDVADGLKNLGAGAARGALQGQMFGRGWSALSPLLRDGSKALKEQLAAAKPVADAFGKDGVNGIKNYIQAQRLMQIQILALQVSFAKNLAPALIQVFNAFGNIVHGGFLQWVINAGKNVVAFVKDIWQHNSAVKDAVSVLVQFVKFEAKVASAAFNAGKAVVGAFGDVIGFFKGAWQSIGDLISKPFQVAVSAITGFINTIIDIINVLPGVNIGHVGGTPSQGKGNAGAVHSKPAAQKQRGGFMVGGQGSGDTVPALLEPGEFVLNREAVAAVGLGNLERTNRKISRFAAGGKAAGSSLGAGKLGANTGNVGPNIAGAIGGLSLPGVGSLPAWIQPVGHYVLAKVGGFIKDKLASAVGGVGGDLLLRGAKGQAAVDAIRNAHPELQPGIAAVLATVLQNTHGLSITSTTGGGHAAGSYHYLGRAVDLAGGDMNASAGWIAHNMAGILTEGIHNPNLSVDMGHGVPASFWGPAVWAEHLNHIHLAKQKGGLIQRLASGGGVSPTHPAHGTHWLGVGNPVNANQGATLLWQAGMSLRDASNLSSVLPDESSGRWTARNPSSGATGIWQILGSVYPGDLTNPVVNSINAAIKWRTQGPGAWPTYPGSGPHGHIMQAAVMGAAAAGTKKKKSKKPGAASGDGGSLGVDQGVQDITQAYFDALQTAVDSENMRRHAINDLYTSANAETLARYQVGASQSGVLGLSAPALGSLYSTLWNDLPDAPTGPDLSGVTDLADINAAAINAIYYAAGLTPPGPYSGAITGAGLVPLGSGLFDQFASTGHFAHGGIVPGPVGKAQRAIVHGGERITPPGQEGDTHVHFYIDGKEIQGITRREMKRSSRRGRRKLPSAGA